MEHIKPVVHSAGFGNTVVGKGRVFVVVTVIGKTRLPFRGQEAENSR